MEPKPAAPLAFAALLTGAPWFTADGRFPPEDPGDPEFLVTPSMPGDLPPADRAAAARSHLVDRKGVTQVEVVSTEEITVSGLPGVEIVARVRLTDWLVLVVLYQLMLFREDGFYLLEGRVRESDREEWLELFRKTARSFRRK